MRKGIKTEQVLSNLFPAKPGGIMKRGKMDKISCREVPLNAVKCNGVNPFWLTPVSTAAFWIKMRKCLVSEPVDWQHKCAADYPLSVISAIDSVFAKTATLSTLPCSKPPAAHSSNLDVSF
jgi:hypothetical protein